MNKKISTLILSCIFLLLSTAVFAQSAEDLNAQLNQAVTQKDWDLAIKIVDKMIVVIPSQAKKLKAYKSELKRMSDSSIPSKSFSTTDNFNANASDRGPSIEKIKSALFNLEVYANNNLPDVQKYHLRCQAWIHSDKSLLLQDVSIRDCDKHRDIKQETLNEIGKYLPDFMAAQEKRCFKHETNDDCQWAKNQIIRITKKYRAMKNDEYNFD